MSGSCWSKARVRLPAGSFLQASPAAEAEMVALVREVLDQLVGSRQGRVDITPLVKPNALLLIGWGEAVDAIIELIKKLDRPVPPDSQFAVFPLQHAAVGSVDEVCEELQRRRALDRPSPEAPGQYL